MKILTASTYKFAKLPDWTIYFTTKISSKMIILRSVKDFWLLEGTPSRLCVYLSIKTEDELLRRNDEKKQITFPAVFFFECQSPEYFIFQFIHSLRQRQPDPPYSWFFESNSEDSSPMLSIRTIFSVWNGMLGWIVDL